MAAHHEVPPPGYESRWSRGPRDGIPLVPGRPGNFMSAPGRNRTCDTRFRKPMLYPLSYEGGPARAAEPNVRPAPSVVHSTGRVDDVGPPTGTRRDRADQRSRCHDGPRRERERLGASSDASHEVDHGRDHRRDPRRRPVRARGAYLRRGTPAHDSALGAGEGVDAQRRPHELAAQLVRADPDVRRRGCGLALPRRRRARLRRHEHRGHVHVHRLRAPRGRRRGVAAHGRGLAVHGAQRGLRLGGRGARATLCPAAVAVHAVGDAREHRGAPGGARGDGTSGGGVLRRPLPRPPRRVAHRARRRP